MVRFRLLPKNNLIWIYYVDFRFDQLIRFLSTYRYICLVSYVYFRFQVGPFCFKSFKLIPYVLTLSSWSLRLASMLFNWSIEVEYQFRQVLLDKKKLATFCKCYHMKVKYQYYYKYIKNNVLLNHSTAGRKASTPQPRTNDRKH